jgi:hypothetical protein
MVFLFLNRNDVEKSLRCTKVSNSTNKQKSLIHLKKKKFQKFQNTINYQVVQYNAVLVERIVCIEEKH